MKVKEGDIVWMYVRKEEEYFGHNDMMVRFIKRWQPSKVVDINPFRYRLRDFEEGRTWVWSVTNVILLPGGSSKKVMRLLV